MTNITAYKFMPKSEAAKQILIDRANIDAVSEVDSEEGQDSVSYIRFTLGKNELYGIPFSVSKAVINDVKFNKPPCSPESIVGVINFRGLLISVLNLASFLGLTGSQKESSSLIIVSDEQLKTYALKVNEIEGIDKYYLADEDFDTSIVTKVNGGADYLLGIHKGKVAILDVNMILAKLKTK